MTILGRLRDRALVAFTLVLGLGGGLWGVVVHHLAGAREVGAPSLALHALRDSVLGLPVIGLGVWVGLQIAGLVVGTEASRLRMRSRLERMVAAAIVAVCAAWTAGAGSLLHGVVFRTSARGHGHGVAEPSGLVHVLRDFSVTLLADLPLALLVGAVLGAGGGAVWVVRHRPARLVASVSFALSALLAPLAAVAPAGAANGAGGNGEGEVSTGPVGALAASVPLATDPGNPCPPGAPAKSFDVTALTVDIPLNRQGDHDPSGVMYALTSQVAAVRAQEASQQVSIGLRTDAIQPLILRANLGDCVTIDFTNTVASGSYGLHVDGLTYHAGSRGDAVGRNAASVVPSGGSQRYVYYVAEDATQEGAHFISPGPGARYEVSHGLFGAFVVEQKGSTYWDPTAPNTPAGSQWEATIVPGDGRPSFREEVLLFHEIGDENTDVFDATGRKLPTIDPYSEAYRPGARAINYRSEPFYNRLNSPAGTATEESHAYSSYTFGDPATPTPRGYKGDPTKFRILHAGSELFHVYHMHGGGIRWRANPHSDATFDYGDTGLRKEPITDSNSTRLDSQAFGPGESYDLEIEGGAGGVQQGAGEFLFHCHISHHYVAGMWSFWRVYDTLQEDFQPLPDRDVLPAAVPSTGLIGKVFNGVTITAENLDAWIRPQLPPPGVRVDRQDATVWDWSVDTNVDAAGPTYLGEPEAQDDWYDYNRTVPGHLTAYPGDVFVGDRPKILFNPDNGRPAFPLLRPHLGLRPPFSGNGHSGAPYLGETADQPPTTAPGVPDPWAGRPDGICPASSPVRTFNITAIELPIQVTAKGATDPNGMLYTLSKNSEKVRTGQMPAEPLAIRANIGDCVAVTLTSEQTDSRAADGYAKTNLHIHHVQFDTQASDGVVSGMSYEQTIRPYQTEDVRMTADAAAGDTAIKVFSLKPRYRPGVALAVGMGTDDIEVHTIASVDATTNTITLAEPLQHAHPSGHWAGTEFVQSRWYPDVQLDNVFWHDHVDGIHNWGHGLVGQFIVEPKGSTYHDPRTGVEVDSGTIVDIRTPGGRGPGESLSPEVSGSFREMALWTIDGNPATDSTLNLRAEPFSDRNGDPAYRFSSYVHGDPVTPMPRAYPGDPVVIRTINVSPALDTLHVDGHDLRTELRAPVGTDGKPAGSPTDTVHYGVSEKYTLVLGGGAGGETHAAGDYLYMNGIGRRFRQGAWGIVRVLPNGAPDLQPLPGRPTPPPGSGVPSPAATPPATAPSSAVCPANAPVHELAVSAVDVPGSSPLGTNNVKAVFTPTAIADDVISGAVVPEPYVGHVAEGECVHVTFTNRRAGHRASFHVSELAHDTTSSGIDIGYNPENTVAPGAVREYWYFASDFRRTAATISDFGGDDTGKIGLYGLLVVAPKGSTFTDAYTGAATDVGSQVIVHPANGAPYRDASLTISDDDPELGQDHMPYPTKAKGPSLVGYQSVASQQRAVDANTFSSYVHGDPNTPIVVTNPNDPLLLHVLSAPGSEQGHVMSLGGPSFPADAMLPRSQSIAARPLAAWEIGDAYLEHGTGAEGDTAVSDLRRAFTEAGMWSLLRTVPAASCEVVPLDGSCRPAPGKPKVAKISPRTGAATTVVTITGTNLSDTTAVAFDGLSATYTVVDASTIQAVAPTGVHSGPISVTTPAGTATSAFAFTVASTGAPVPEIVSFSPGHGVAGDTVTITGTMLTGATRVRFAGVPATFTSGGATSVVAVVPVGAGTGPITIDTPAARTTSAAVFTVDGAVAGAPAIKEFGPEAGPIGTSIRIEGAGLGSAQVVLVNNHPTPFTITDDHTVVALVPAFADSGPITVQTAGGIATSSGRFTVANAPTQQPLVTALSSRSVAVGGTVLIRGQHLGSVRSVTFGGVAAVEVSVVSDTTLMVVVPQGAKSGAVLVTTPGGTARAPKRVAIKKRTES